MGTGASLTTPAGVLCLGGASRDRHHADVFLLVYEQGEVRVETWPALPEARAGVAAALLGDTVYLAGGIDHPRGASRDNFWIYPLAEGQTGAWHSGPTWPGPARHYALAAVQERSFFLVGGKHHRLSATGELQRGPPFADAYRYNPPKGDNPGHWQRVTDAPRPIIAAPSPAPALGQGHFVVLGGNPPDPEADRQTLPAFTGDILLYHSITDRWSAREPLPAGTAPFLAPLVSWQGLTVMVGGEDAPASRTPRVVALLPGYNTPSFGWVNWAVIIVYFSIVAAVGYIFARRRNKSTKDYFLAGGRIPWWAAGISIFGTQLSAQSFMGNPAIGFADDWSRWLKFTGAILAAPLVIAFYLPFYRRLQVTSVYEYLEKRFSMPVRLYGSLKFILTQLVRIGVLLYLPSVALATATGINLHTCLVAITIFTICYTMLGGMEAVVWTDIVQVTILLGGGVLCLGLVLHSIGGVGEFVTVAVQDQKFNIFDWRWDPTAMVVWVLIVGPLFINIGTYSSDQAVVQRYLTTKDEKSAAKSILTNAIITIPISFLFLPLGTALYIFYQQFPEALVPGKNDAILPQFIVHQLPAGLAGLMIAAVFAATMSSLDSSMNSVSAASVTDFYRRFASRATDRQCLRLARILTLLVGLMGLGTAFLLAAADIRLIVDRMILLMGLMGGGLTGVFMLGIFTTRANSWGALAGAITGFITPLFTYYHTDLNVFLYGAIGTLTCVGVGYVVSLVTPAQAGDRSHLTIRNLKLPPVT
jgi:SSS family transporter